MEQATILYALTVTSDEILKWAGFVTAVGAAVVMLWKLRKVLKTAFQSWWEKQKAWNELPTTVKILKDEVKVIKDELSPNHGSSLNDKITNIHKTVQLNAARVLAVQDRSPTAIYECDKEGRAIVANKAICKIFEMTQDQMTGKDGKGHGWTAAIATQEERERVYHSWMTAIAEGIPYRESYKLINGKRVTTTADPIVSEMGEVLGFRGVLWLDEDEDVEAHEL